MISLVGYTGFVGSNLASQANFDGLYNSKNISKAFGTNPQLLIYSGVRAEKYLANNQPQKDLDHVKEAISNIQKIGPETLVLISTIDVYKKPEDVDEDTVIDTEELHAYGLNRYYLEEWVEENIEKHLIVRLPGLYGQNIKKNFIFDLINIIPSMLKEAKFVELCEKDRFIAEYYIDQKNGFYKCQSLNQEERIQLKAYFNNIGFSALNFTDSRASFQFYNLNFLWKHIQFALEKGIRKMNLSTEPVVVGELYKFIKGTDFENEVAPVPPKYNFKTKYDGLFGGKDGYIYDKSFVLEDIKKFVEGYGI